MSSLNIRHNQTLKNYRKKLIELRLINIEKYEGLTHKYSIIITPSISDRVTPSKSDRVNDTTLSKNDTYKAQYMSKNDRVPPLLYKEREDIDIDQYFEKFWNLYPRKIGKAAAKKKFEKINPDNKLLNKMMNAVSQQKRTDQWQNEKFIPHPTTWLNQERWNDEINTENLSHDQAVRLCTEFGLKLSKDFKYIDKNQYIRND
jgi:hypothetical protein